MKRIDKLTQQARNIFDIRSDNAYMAFISFDEDKPKFKQWKLRIHRYNGIETETYATEQEARAAFSFKGLHCPLLIEGEMYD